MQTRFNSRSEDVESIDEESDTDDDVDELQPSQTAMVVVSSQEHAQSRDTIGIGDLFEDPPQTLDSKHGQTINNTPDKVLEYQ